MTSTMFRAFVKEALALQTEDSETPPDYVSTRAAVMQKLGGSLGRHALEIHGLYTLGKSPLKKMRGKEVDEKTQAREEVQGLSELAAPYAHDIAKSYSKSYSNAAKRVAGSGIGKRLSFLGKAVGH